MTWWVLALSAVGHLRHLRNRSMGSEKLRLKLRMRARSCVLFRWEWEELSRADCAFADCFCQMCYLLLCWLRSHAAVDAICCVSG